MVDRIAVISDIHGNIPALEATLADIERRGITQIFCLGDLVGKGPSSDRAVDICRAVCAATVRGNWDDGMLADTDDPMVRWHRPQLGPARLAYLAALPNTIDFVMSGKRVRLFHASQRGVYHRVHMYASIETHMDMFANTDFTGDAPAPDMVGYGDIHATFLHSLNQRILFNVGSVGNPLDLALAAYAILEGSYGSAEPDTFSVQLVRVPYDIDEAVRQAEHAQMPALQDYIQELRTARYRGLPN